MKNKFERIYTEWEIRRQPWEDSDLFPDAHYYNFREKPDLIYKVLEDFKPFEKYEAVQDFYKLLEWANGSDSPFETNDCRLSLPEKNDQRYLADKDLVRSGTLLFFFRNLKDNISPDSMYWYKKYKSFEINADGLRHKPSKKINSFVTRSSEELSKTENHETNIIMLGLAPTSYDFASNFPSMRNGYQFMWRFWMWGNTDEEIMENFKFTVNSMTLCLKNLADEFTP